MKIKKKHVSNRNKQNERLNLLIFTRKYILTLRLTQDRLIITVKFIWLQLLLLFYDRQHSTY
jgi:hypothetical protein